jgi:hypothetical protein
VSDGILQVRVDAPSYSKNERPGFKYDARRIPAQVLVTGWAARNFEGNQTFAGLVIGETTLAKIVGYTPSWVKAKVIERHDDDITDTALELNHNQVKHARKDKRWYTLNTADDLLEYAEFTAALVRDNYEEASTDKDIDRSIQYWARGRYLQHARQVVSWMQSVSSELPRLAAAQVARARLQAPENDVVALNPTSDILTALHDVSRQQQHLLKELETSGLLRAGAPDLLGTGYVEVLLRIHTQGQFKFPEVEISHGDGRVAVVRLSSAPLVILRLFRGVIEALAGFDSQDWAACLARLQTEREPNE